MSCLTNFIGIRGECEGTPKMYIDDLPGINIQNVADVVEGMQLRPKDLVESSFNLAFDSVFNDWVSLMQGAYNYNAVVSDNHYKNAGIFEYYGLVNKTVALCLYRTVTYSKFTKIRLYDFEIVSDREIEKTFTVVDEYGTVLHNVTQTLVAGRNKINLDVELDADELYIRFSISDFKVGKNDQWSTWYNGTTCNPCMTSGCLDCTYMDVRENTGAGGAYVASNNQIGFNLKTQCLADRCAIVDYFIADMKTPLLYKTGINYLIAARATSRVNSYTRNSQEKINELLLSWQGGTDMTNGIKTQSTYWNAVKVAAASTEKMLSKTDSKVFTYAGTEICNILP
jgi:hypothetical protein